MDGGGGMSEQETCEWWDEDGVWASSCGIAFVFNEGDPAENKFNFCYNCGKPIRVESKTQETDQ